MLGDGITKWMAHELLHWPDPFSLGINGIHLVVRAIPGFRISGVRTWWLNYIKEHRAPDILVFCLGGNELASHQVEVPWKAIKKALQFIRKKCPRIKLVWSDILPRKNYFTIPNHVGEQNRKYINAKSQSLCDGVLHHSRIQMNLNIWENGVILNRLGCSFFIQDLFLFLRFFVSWAC